MNTKPSVLQNPQVSILYIEPHDLRQLDKFLEEETVCPKKIATESSVLVRFPDFNLLSTKYARPSTLSWITILLN